MVVQRFLVNEKEIMKTAQSMNEVGQKRKRSMENERQEFEGLLQEKITANYLRKCVNIHTVKAVNISTRLEKKRF